MARDGWTGDDGSQTAVLRAFQPVKGESGVGERLDAEENYPRTPGARFLKG
jgi:hypothetical protein